MLADTRGLGEWGFAALVEADGHRVLFDTGDRPDTVPANARELGVDLSDVSDVILSHHHGDHTGGLLALRRALMKDHPRAPSRCYVGRGIFLPRPREDGREANETRALKAPYEATGGRFVEVGEPTQISPGAWLTGSVPRKHPERNWSGRGQVRTAEGLVDRPLITGLEDPWNFFHFPTSEPRKRRARAWRASGGSVGASRKLLSRDGPISQLGARRHS